MEGGGVVGGGGGESSDEKWVGEGGCRPLRGVMYLSIEPDIDSED